MPALDQSINGVKGPIRAQRTACRTAWLNVAAVAIPDLRKGEKIILLTEQELDIDTLSFKILIIILYN